MGVSYLFILILSMIEEWMDIGCLEKLVIFG